MNIREQMLKLVEANMDDETEDDFVAEARSELLGSIETFVDDWDDYAKERWWETGVDRFGPNPVVLPPRTVRDSDVRDLPEFKEVEALTRSIDADMQRALRALEHAESEARSTYNQAREKLVALARKLPGYDKKRHYALSKDD